MPGRTSSGRSAEQAEARLQRLGFAVRAARVAGNVRTGDWVRVENLATPEDAANALAQLQAAGIADAYVLDGGSARHGDFARRVR